MIEVSKHNNSYIWEIKRLGCRSSYSFSSREKAEKDVISVHQHLWDGQFCRLTKQIDSMDKYKFIWCCIEKRIKQGNVIPLFQTDLKYISEENFKHHNVFFESSLNFSSKEECERFADASISYIQGGHKDSELKVFHVE